MTETSTTHDNASREGFRPDIEGLRAVAVVSVVLYHANLLGVHGGYVGVDVFFVISGFLITRLLLRSVGKQGLRALPTFYTRRIRRLLPAAMTVVVATVIAARIWAPALSVKSISIDGIFTTFYGLNYRLAVEGTNYLNEGAMASPLQHYWSLAVEEQFYLCWPIMMAGVVLLARRYYGGRSRNLLLGLLLAAVLAISFFFSITVTRSDAPWAYFSLSTRAWELALGALVALGAPYLARVPGLLRASASWAGLVAVITTAFLFGASTPYPGSAAAIPDLGAALIIAGGCTPKLRHGRPARDFGAARFLGLAPLQFAGRVSYSWYLWHWPMLVIAPLVIGHPLTWQQRLAIVFLSLLAAVVTYHLIENPARSLSMPNARWLAGGFALSGTAIIAATVVLANLPTTVGPGAPVNLATGPPPTAVVSSGLHVAAQRGRSSHPKPQPATPQQLAKPPSIPVMLDAAMEQDIKMGLQTTAVPSNLTPTPSAAHNDVPISSSDGCHANYLVITQPACVFGDPAGRETVVLFGDSHMQQWQPAFIAAATEEHWRVVNWTKTACPPAELTVFSSVLNRNYTECDTWRAETLKRIAALKPNLVVVTGSEDLAPASVSPSTYARAMARTLRTLNQTTSAKVVYFQDTPYPGSNMAGCVAAHLTDAKLCNFPISRAYTYPARHRETADMAKKAGAQVVDPAKWICIDQTCPAIVGNLLVFRDQSHISVEFSTWLAPVIALFLETEAPGPAR